MLVGLMWKVGTRMSVFGLLDVSCKTFKIALIDFFFLARKTSVLLISEWWVLVEAALSGQDCTSCPGQ